MNVKIDHLKAQAAFNLAVEKALTIIGMRLVAEAKINIQKKHKVDTGLLLNSLGYKTEINGTGLCTAPELQGQSQPNNSVIAGTNVNYAEYVEYGTRPHRTDWKADEFKESMAGWFRRHGIVDKGIQYLIIRHIRKHGTLKKPFLRPAFDKVKKQAEAITAYAFKTVVDSGGKA